MRGNTEVIELFRTAALVAGTTYRRSEGLPVGEGWIKVMLEYALVLTIGTGATPLAEGLLRILRGITIKTSKGDRLVDNVPARALYRFAQLRQKEAPVLDAVAAADGTYRVLLPLWFIDPLMLRPEDTLFDTSPYSDITLEVALGTLADVLTTVGTATATHSLTMVLERQKGPVALQTKPRLHIEYGIRPPVDPTSVTEITLERSSDLSYKRVMLFASTASTAGVPFSGNANDAILDDVSIRHDGGNPFDTILGRLLRNQNLGDYGMAAAVTGQIIADFVRDGSIQSVVLSGDKSRLSANWTNGTLPATPQVTMAYEALRTLKR